MIGNDDYGNDEKKTWVNGWESRMWTKIRTRLEWQIGRQDREELMTSGGRRSRSRRCMQDIDCVVEGGLKRGRREAFRSETKENAN
jgi:hypothetical protein